MRLKVANEDELLSKALKTGARVRLENGRLLNADSESLPVSRPKPAPAAPAPAKEPEAPKLDLLVQSLVMQVGELTRMMQQQAREIAELRAMQAEKPEPEEKESEQIVVQAPPVTVNVPPVPDEWEVVRDADGRLKGFRAGRPASTDAVTRILDARRGR